MRIINNQHEWLKYYPVLSELGDAAWLSALDKVEYVTVPAGSVVFKPGQSCRGLLFVVHGSVRVSMVSGSGREISLYRLQQGELCVLTLATLLRSADYAAAEALTETETRVVCLPTEHFRSAFAGSQTFQDYMLDKLTTYLHDTLMLFREVAFDRLDMRLASLLFRRFKSSQVVDFSITHQQVALELGTTREVVSRMLKDLERNNCVRLMRGRIQLVNVEQLEQLACKRTAVAASGL